jgi:hypothetical protein
MLIAAYEHQTEGIPVLTIGNLQSLGRVFGPIRERLLGGNGRDDEVQESGGSRDGPKRTSGDFTRENRSTTAAEAEK